MPRIRRIFMTASFCVAALAGCNGREPSNDPFASVPGRATEQKKGLISTFGNAAQPKAKYPGLKDLYVARDEYDDVVLLANSFG